MGRYNAAQSQKGETKISEIMEAAKRVFIEHGRNGFSMRKIASEAGMAVGNLHYYYRAKDDILHDLLDYSIKSYESIFDDIYHDGDKSVEEKLSAIISHIIKDLGSRETTRFFPELWALANHDEYAADGMHRLYQRGRRHIRLLVGRINPRLSDEQCRIVALFISSSLEGLTMFVGHEKPWAGARETMATFAADGFTKLVRDLEPDQVNLESMSGKLPPPMLSDAT